MSNLIIHGDTNEVLKGMESESVDAVITDPPFGIGFIYLQKEKCSTPDEYWQWLSPIHNEMMRVLKKGGFFAMWQTQLYFPHFWNWFGNDIHIYAACKNFVQLRRTGINYAYDPVIMKYKSGAEPLKPSNPPRNVDFFVANTAKFILDVNSLARMHPCPRPVDQVSEIVRNFTPEGSTILDPFFGSGTTGIACIENGRKIIGIEIVEEYVKIANKRMDKFYGKQQKRDLMSWIDKKREEVSKDALGEL